MKNMIWEKLSLASSEEVQEVAECVPWCVAPFGLSDDIQTIIDSQIFDFDSYLFSPGVTTETIELNPQDLKKIYNKANAVFL